MSADWLTQRDALLLTLENEKRPLARTQAADALCALASGRPLEDAAEFAGTVPRLLSDAQPEVRCAGVALGAQVLPEEEAVGICTQALADKHPRVRVEGAGILADLAIASTRGALAHALEDEFFEVRFEAARGMAALKHKSGVPILIEALDDKHLRFRALGALGALGDSSALPRVKELFGKWLLPAFERTQAAGVLAALGDAEGETFLLKRSEARSALDRGLAIELLGVCKSEVTKARLLSILADDKDSMRGAAARGLGRRGESSALPSLTALARSASLDDDDRLDVAEGLLLLGGDEARAAVLAMQFSNEDARLEWKALLLETAESSP